jgi:hypothetical protein
MEDALGGKYNVNKRVEKRIRDCGQQTTKEKTTTWDSEG